MSHFSTSRLAFASLPHRRVAFRFPLAAQNFESLPAAILRFSLNDSLDGFRVTKEGESKQSEVKWRK